MIGSCSRSGTKAQTSAVVVARGVWHYRAAVGGWLFRTVGPLTLFKEPAVHHQRSRCLLTDGIHTEHMFTVTSAAYIVLLLSAVPPVTSCTARYSWRCRFVSEGRVVLWWVLMAGLRGIKMQTVRSGGGWGWGCYMVGEGKSACIQSPAVLCISNNMEKAMGLPWEQIQNQRSTRTPLL